MPPWCSSATEPARRGAPRWLALPLLAALAGCGDRTTPVAQPTRSEVWAEVQAHAARYRLDPAFVFAVVAAESNFDAAARNGEARGLMQIKPAAWRTVSDSPYEPRVWDWRENLRVGIDYLAWCRHTLHAKGEFSYPALLAAFHYGLDHMERRGFDPAKVAVPDNAVYRELWRGNLQPVPPPS
ncbi:MAG TPA: transglycosylase SLT domain-containing protein [Opitutaceae bacterium]|nr:transglycosylase SLT domain-containing protein [Opitutaceae bacterium]